MRVSVGMAGESYPGNFYAAGTLDRAGHLRRLPEWLEQALHRPLTRFVPMWRGQSLFSGPDDAPSARLLTLAQATLLSGPEIGAAPLDERLVFLGITGPEPEAAAYFALDLGAGNAAPDIARVEQQQLRFADLRAVGPLIARPEGAILAAARGLVHWHGRHRFCPVCGHPTVPEQAGHVRRCTNAACASTHFPRTDPAVIMLVTDGDRALLGRQAAWATGLYSTLAGFVEIGESLEDAVAREVREESGILVGRVTYHSSQPWPFPASLMLGFSAEARSTEITVDQEELQDARWFERSFLQERVRDPSPPAEGAFRLPRLDSIARRMILDWVG